MKVAFLFAGQLRDVNHDLFRKSLSILTKDLDYSIFSFCWEEAGKSLNHQKNISKLKTNINIEESLKLIFGDFNLLNYGYESFNDFKNNLSHKYKLILDSEEFHYGTINSLPQIYTLFKSFQLMEKINYDFDLVFRCRFDSIFMHQMNLFPLEEIYLSNYLYHLNFGRSYYPNRIYDIFFGGSRKSMNFIRSIWNDIPMLIENKFNNGLDKRDCCRLLSVSAKLKKIKIKSLDSRICDVYRNDNSLYVEYLIKSHIFKLQIRKNYLIKFYFFLRCFKLMKISNKKVIFYFLITFLYLPFTYLKRLRYLKVL